MTGIKDVARMAYLAGSRFSGSSADTEFEDWWADAGIIEREGGYSGAAMHLEEIHRLHKMIHTLRAKAVTELSDEEIDQLAGVEPQCAACHGYGPESGQAPIPVILEALDTTLTESLTAILPSLNETLAKLGVKLMEVRS